jgi:hypothetical protein
MLLKYFASIYPLGASVLKHLIILECPTSGHLTKFFNFLSNPHPLPAPLPPGINIDRCITSDNFTRQEQNLPLNGLIRLSAYRMHPVYPVSSNVARCEPYFIILLCLTPDDVTRQRESAWIQYMHYKKLSDNKNINLKMPRFLWQGNLPNRASKIKCLLARR